FNLNEMDLMISKTGYTGEETGYEIYLHPENAPFIWNLILEKGAYFGVKPAGLAARDSARVEAGFPLYGHELAGDYELSPIEAGYGAFIKLHKPFFIGKNAILSQAEKIQREIIRFKVSQKGIRMVRPDDLMLDQKGIYIGRVTSSVLIENIQIGMAWVKTNFIKPQDEIGIFPKINLKGKIKEELNLGDKVFTPYKGEVLSRFKEN
ncbi:MAG: aminomethyl transferase family protein, partial [Armatimonadetes bacterium]|nr:aminomethyl transferase family protein [Armatimonadota bacterium]